MGANAFCKRVIASLQSNQNYSQTSQGTVRMPENQHLKVRAKEKKRKRKTGAARVAETASAR